MLSSHHQPITHQNQSRGITFQTPAATNGGARESNTTNKKRSNPEDNDGNPCPKRTSNNITTTAAAAAISGEEEEGEITTTTTTGGREKSSEVPGQGREDCCSRVSSSSSAVAVEVDQTFSRFGEFLDQLKHDTNTIRRELKSVTAERDGALKRLEEVQTARDVAQAQVADLQKRLVKATESKHRAKESTKLMETKLQDAAEDVRKAEESTKLMETKLHAAAEDVRKAEESTKLMETKLHAAAEDVRKAEESAKLMEANVRKAEESAKRMEAKLHAAAEDARRMEQANDELESKLSNAEINLEHVRRLEEDITTWERMYSDLKTEKEQLEMVQFRPLRQENERLKKSSADSAEEFATLKKSFQKKAKSLAAEFERFRKESLETIAMKDNMIGNLNLNLSGSMQESRRMREEIESLRKLTASLETNNRKMGQDLIGYDRDLRTLHELYDKQAALEQQLSETCRQKSEMEGRLGSLFTDALLCETGVAAGKKKKSDDGTTGILLKSGAMASFKCIAEYWRDHADGFDGSVSFPVRYPESSSSSSPLITSTIVHERAVLNFVRTVALLSTQPLLSSLTTDYPFYFRFSALPQEEGGEGKQKKNGVAAAASSESTSSSWKVYEPYDQLTLIAKTIFMYRSKEDRSFFRIELAEEGHMVTAVCTTKTVVAADSSGTTKAVRQAKFSLTVFSSNGRSKMHSIQFVDSNNNPVLAADASAGGGGEPFFKNSTGTGATTTSSFSIVENNNDDDASSSTFSQQ